MDVAGALVGTVVAIGRTILLAIGLALWVGATQRLYWGSRIDRVCDASLTGAWILVTTFYCTAPFGRFRFGVALACLGLAAITAFFLTRLAPVPPSFARKRLRAPVRTKISSGALRWLLWPSAVLLVLASVARALKSLVGPPVGWDAVTYHLPRAVEWLQSASWNVQPGVDSWDYYSWFTAGGEILFAWALLAPRSDILVAPLDLCVWLLIGLSVWRIAQRLGASQTVRWVAAAAIFTLPCVARFAGANNVDNFVLFFSLTLVVHTLDWVGEKRPASFLLGAMAASLAVAVKYTAIGIVTASALIIAYHWLRHRVRPTLPIAVGAGGLALPALIWIFRVWSVQGSPFYPLRTPLTDLFGLPYSEHLHAVLQPEAGFSVRSLYETLAFQFWSNITGAGHMNFGIGGFLLLGASLHSCFNKGVLRRQLPLVLALGAAVLISIASVSGDSVTNLRTVWAPTLARLVAPSVIPFFLLICARSEEFSLKILGWALVGNVFHQLPIGWTPRITPGIVTLLSAFVAGALIVWFASRFSRGRRWVTIGLAVGVFVLLFPVWSYVRQEHRYTAYAETRYDGPYLAAHAMDPYFYQLTEIARVLDTPEPKKIAFSVGSAGLTHHHFRYPLYGSHFQNTIVWIPTTSVPDEERMTPAQRAPFLDEGRWRSGVLRSGVEYVVGTWPATPERAWVESRPEQFRLLSVVGPDSQNWAAEVLRPASG